ncbi:MAG: BrnA antitoxin family protein [Terriglobales bacterium]
MKSPGRPPKAKRSAGTNWAKLRRMSDAQIRRGIASDPDLHATDEAFWKDAKVVWPTPESIVTMRLDADLLAWFRQQRGYQTRINAILRAYMKAHESGDRG